MGSAVASAAAPQIVEAAHRGPKPRSKRSFFPRRQRIQALIRSRYRSKTPSPKKRPSKAPPKTTSEVTSPPAEATQSGPRSILRRSTEVRPRVGRLGRLWRKLTCSRRSSGPGAARRIFFVESVEVSEYSRQLGGSDGVPTDGSLVALGLGQILCTRSRSLSQKRGARRIDEISWMPAETRAKVLEACMGTDAYSKAWAQEEPLMANLQVTRRESKQDLTDYTVMPTSFREARARADEIAAESAAAIAATKKEQLVQSQVKAPTSSDPTKGSSLKRSLPEVCEKSSGQVKKMALSAFKV